MNKKIFKQKSRGQIIVILAGVLVVLLGFTALAIDGAMVYSDRRYAQNAADAAALAGAGMAAEYMENSNVRYETFNCSNTDVLGAIAYGENKAIDRAASNNFIMDDDISDNMGVEITCHYIYLGSFYDEYLDVRVKLTADTSTSFAQLFYSGDMVNQVESVVRVHPRTNLGMGNAIASLGHDCSTGGLTAHGNVDVHTTGAGIFSNSCMDFNGSALSVTADDPLGAGIRYYSTMSTSGHPYIDPFPTQSPNRLKVYDVGAPDCASLPFRGSATTSGTYLPGRYTSIGGNGQKNFVLQPGLYCLTGNLGMNNGSLTGHGVTFYFTGSGSYDVAGNVEVHLTAPMGDDPPAMRGMLMYIAGTGSVNAQGNANSVYTGTIYAPYGSIEAGGNSDLGSIDGQLIGKKVSVGGTSDIAINFGSDQNYQIPASLDVMQ